MRKEFSRPSGNIFFRHYHTAPSRIGKGIIHPHPDPLPSREREIKEKVTRREREIEETVFHGDKFYCNLARPSARAE